MMRALSIALLLFPSMMFAQRTDSLTRALNKFSSGAAIQVNESRGHFFGVKNSAIVFEDRSSVREIPFSTVDELWKQSSHWKTGDDYRRSHSRGIVCYHRRASRKCDL